MMFVNNDDVLFRIMECLGPRHVCLGLGSTCHELRKISQSDSLWKVFWGARSLLDSEKVLRGGDSDFDSDNTDAIGPHDAAMVFRHAMHTMNMSCKIIPPSQSKQTNGDNDDVHAINSHSGGTMSIYQAYIIQHISMKESNFRVEATLEDPFPSKLIHRMCTQTWPGQLSLLHADTHNINNNNRLETCQKSAVVWCDHPHCHHARCGIEGCLRSYRFALPMRDDESNNPSQYTGPDVPMARIGRECSERNYDVLSFVWCSWCHVSFCWEHVYSRRNGYYEQEQRSNKSGSSTGAQTKRCIPWYKCEECNLSSCPDCVSQVFLTSPPNMDGCGVVTAGKRCRRTVCPQCMWYVGRKKQGSKNSNSILSGNVPGGDYTRLCKTEICTVRGMDLLSSNNTCWDEFETCCSKCLRHVDFRWRELTRVQDSFLGFMP